MTNTAADNTSPGNSTLSIKRAEIDERDPTLRITLDHGEPFTVLLVQKLISIGKNPNIEVPIPTEGVAERHARLMLEGATYRLFDLTGARGVLVNGQLSDNVILHDGDVIRLQDSNGRGATLYYANPVERSLGSTSVGRIFMLDKSPFIIGRNPQANIHIDSMAVSWNHALITEENGKHTVSDMGSTNGTMVNERRLTGPYRLQLEDVIRIDKLLFVYKGRGLQRLAEVQKLQIDAAKLDMTYRTGFPAKTLNTMRDVSLSIYPEEFVAIIGGSGSGKSTLLRALNGAMRATGGTVYINGESLYDKYEQYQPVIGYVPQQDIVHNNLTVWQSLWFSARLRFPNEPQASIEQRINRALESIEMADYKDRLVGNLSGGQKKRVSIAMELMADPRLLFMDEPSSGLDPGLDKDLMDTLRQLADRGHVVVVVTHTTLNIEQCNKLLFMARGNLAYFGPPTEALTFFNVDSYPAMYNRVQQSPNDDPASGTPSKPIAQGEAASQWADKFRRSPLYETHITRRMLPVGSQQAKPNILSNRRLAGSRRGTFFQQAKVLTQRTLALARHDMRTLLGLLLVLPLVGLFLGLINFDKQANTRGQMLIQRFETQADELFYFGEIPLEPVDVTNTPVGEAPAEGGNAISGKAIKALGTYSPASDAQRLLFMMALSVVLLGIFSAAYTIVEERSLFLRERMVNLRIRPYLASKVIVYSALAIISSILFLITLSIGVKLPAQGVITWGPLEIFITLLLTAVAGISIGLLLSSVANRVDAVTYMVLGVLFAQILLPGVLFRMDGALEPISRLTITRWALEALGSSTNITARNEEARIIVASPVINPRTNKPIPGTDDNRQLFPGPSTLSVTYPTDANGLLLRWGVLLGFSLIFLTVAGYILGRTTNY